MSTTTVPTQIRIDADLKKDANELFKELGMDMSTAVNMFLRQCVLYEGIPFAIKKNHFSKELLAAMEESETLARDPNAKKYSDLQEMWRDLEEGIDEE